MMTSPDTEFTLSPPGTRLCSVLYQLQHMLHTVFQRKNWHNLPEVIFGNIMMMVNTLRSRVVDRTAEEHVDWNNLPDVIFGDIMMMVGLENLETLHSCRQVCRSWNEMIVGNKIFQYNLKSFISVRDDQFTEIQERCG